MRIHRVILAVGLLTEAVATAAAAGEGGFVWQRPRPALPDRLLPPWTPLRTAEDTAELWGRTYRFDPSGLPRQVVSQGEPLLAGASFFTLNGERMAAAGTGLEWLERSETRVAARGSAESAEVLLTTCTAVEFDGFCQVTVTVSPRRPADLHDLTLAVPLRKEQATLLNFSDVAAEGGQKPWHPGSLRRFLVRGRWCSAFLPVLWLGNERTGFAWCAESTEGWDTAGTASEIEVVEEPEAVHLQVHFLQPSDPTRRIAAPFSLTFGWMATPAKPLPEGWRNWQFVLETNEQRGRRKGNVSILWHSLWSEALGSPRPRDPALLAQRVEQCHRDGYKAIIYVAYTDTMASIASEGGDFEKTVPQQPIPEVRALGDEWSHAPCVGGHWGLRTCIRSSWGDFLLHYLDEDLRRYDIDGVYFDNIPLLRCHKAGHGCGYDAADGSRRVTNTLFAQREFFRQVYRLFHESGKVPLIMVHSSMEMLVPSFSFVQATLDGEEFNAAWRPPHNFDHLIPLDTFRAHFLGQPFGLVPCFLPSPCFRSVQESREHLAYTLLHDLLLLKGWLEPEVLEKVWQAKASFGFGREGATRFTGYWENDGAISIHPDHLRVSSWESPGALLIACANLGLTPETGLLQIDEARLGGIRDLADALTGEPVDCRQGQVRVGIGPKDFRLLEGRRAAPRAPPARRPVTSLSPAVEARSAGAPLFRDRSGRGNHVLSGSYWQVVPSHRGSAIEFLPGNGGHLRVPSGPGLAAREELTIEAWVCLDGSAQGPQKVVIKEGDTDPVRNPCGFEAYCLTVGSQGDVQFHLTLGDARVTLATPAKAVPPGSWVHLAATYDGREMAVHVDARLLASQPAQGRIFATAGPLVIGNTDCAFREQLAGKLDEVCLWDRARSVTEVERDRTTPPEPGSPGLVGYWNFDPAE
jgi:hypothetical protein